MNDEIFIRKVEKGELDPIVEMALALLDPFENECGWFTTLSAKPEFIKSDHSGQWMLPVRIRKLDPVYECLHKDETGRACSRCGQLLT